MIRPRPVPAQRRARPRATLRRLDWRFLLPYPHTGKFRHLLLCGGPEGLAERIVAANVADAVSTNVDAPRPVDAVVVLHDSPLPWTTAISNLEAGGVLYREVRRNLRTPWRTTPARMRAELAPAGLSLGALYWVAPDFDQARRYVPLDAAGAVDWYFTSLFVAGSPWHAAARTLIRRTVGQHSHRLAPFVPCLALVATADTRPAHLPSVLAEPALRKHLPADDVRPLLLTSGQDDASRVILLPFAAQRALHQVSASAATPPIVMKLATQSTFNVETELEQSVQREVRATLDAALRQSVPQPLNVVHYHDLAVSVESFAPGRTMWVSSGSWHVSARAQMEDLTRGAAWLTEFHRQTEQARPAWSASAAERWLHEPLAEYARLRGLSPAEAHLFARLRAHAVTLDGVPFPLVWQHHDFAPWNVYRAGPRLTVIDWEGNRDWERTRAGPSLCDLIYFVTYWHSVVQRLGSLDAEVAALAPLWVAGSDGGPYVRAARQAVACYMTQRALDWRWLPLLLAYTWIERVVYSHARAQKLAAGEPKSSAADRFATYVGQLAMMADALFDANYPGFWQKSAAQAQGSSL